MDATDNEIVEACHAYVGKNTVLDLVVEIFADMTTEELERVVFHPISLTLPRRVLFCLKNNVKRP